MCISVPIFQDENTAGTLARQREDLEQRLGAEAVAGLPLDGIYMDCMAFGMGAGCLQMTFQAQVASAHCLACAGCVPVQGQLSSLSPIATLAPASVVVVEAAAAAEAEVAEE